MTERLKQKARAYLNKFTFEKFGFGAEFDLSNYSMDTIIDFASYCLGEEEPESDPVEVKLLLQPTGSVVIYKQKFIPEKGDVIKYKGREFDVKGREFVIEGGFIRVICKMRGAKNNGGNRF